MSICCVSALTAILDVNLHCRPAEVSYISPIEDTELNMHSEAWFVWIICTVKWSPGPLQPWMLCVHLGNWRIDARGDWQWQSRWRTTSDRWIRNSLCKRVSVSLPAGYRNPTIKARSLMSRPQRVNKILPAQCRNLSMFKTWVVLVFYHKKSEYLVREWAGIGDLGSMTPISGVYQRRSISPLLLALARKAKSTSSRSLSSLIAINKNLSALLLVDQVKKKPREEQFKCNDYAETSGEHVSGRAKWWQQDNPAARRAPSYVRLMESVRYGVEPLSSGECCRQSSSACLRRLSFPQQRGRTSSPSWLLTARTSASPEFTEEEMRRPFVCCYNVMTSCMKCLVKIKDIKYKSCFDFLMYIRYLVFLFFFS